MWVYRHISVYACFLRLHLLPYSSIIFLQSVMTFKLVLRAGVPKRAVNLLSCSLSCSLGLIALNHHGIIILKLDVHQKVWMLAKMTGTLKKPVASSALSYEKQGLPGKGVQIARRKKAVKPRNLFPAEASVGVQISCLLPIICSCFMCRRTFSLDCWNNKCWFPRDWCRSISSVSQRDGHVHGSSHPVSGSMIIVVPLIWD